MSDEVSRVSGEVSREAAKECSPRRKPWEESKTWNKPRRGERR